MQQFLARDIDQETLKMLEDHIHTCQIRGLLLLWQHTGKQEKFVLAAFSKEKLSSETLEKIDQILCVAGNYFEASKESSAAVYSDN